MVFVEAFADHNIKQLANDINDWADERREEMYDFEIISIEYSSQTVRGGDWPVLVHSALVICRAN